MKILFSADWHIKICQKNVPIDWAKDRYKSMFEQLHVLEKEHDLHVIGGDLFDRAPSLEELELYFEFISGCNCQTIIFAGNHEAEKKNTTFFTKLASVTSRLNTYVMIIDDYYSIANMDFIPYNKLKEFEKEQPKFNGNLLFTHVRGAIEPHVKPEVDLSIFEPWKLVLAGDLHSHSNSQRNIIYPGSPVTTSFHRNEVDTGVVSINSDTLEWDWVKLEVPQLIRKTIKAGEAMPKTGYHHTIYEVTGDITQLSAVAHTDLLDKKVVKRSTDCALILNPEASIQEELSEYLEFIMELPAQTIEEALKVYNDHIKNS